MIVLTPVTPDVAPMFQAVRLRALQDAPTAFGSTYAQESALFDADWRQRAAKWSNATSVGCLAVDDGEGCGIAGGFLDVADPTRANLISMWTAPTHRNRGIGRLLVGAVLAWAHSRGAETLRLMVTSSNLGAIRFYERLGFTMTGETEPYPNDPALTEFAMSRPVVQG